MNKTSLAGVSTDVWVKSYSHLKDRPKSKDALPYLQRIASLVKPIMRKHNWKLPLLAEFFPKEDNLVGMNVNRGQKIYLRLRPARSPDSFYEEEDVLGTMLHELTHNVYGPHDEKFYKFLAGLEDDYDELKRSGFAGEGFHTQGNRLGSDIACNIPLHLAKAKALQAAEKRQRVGDMMSGRGRLGGGGKTTAGISPRELAAEAAERRACDAKACQSGHVAEVEAEVAAKDSIIDLTLEEDEPKAPYVWPDSDPDDSDIEFVDKIPEAGPSKLPKRKQKAEEEPFKVAQAATRTSAAFALAQMRTNPETSSSNSTKAIPSVGNGSRSTASKQKKDTATSQSKLAVESKASSLTRSQLKPSTSRPSPATSSSISRVRVEPYPRTRPVRNEPVKAKPGDVSSKAWACSSCTFINAPMALQCSVCYGLRPSGF